MSIQEEAARWFDQFLKGNAIGLLREAPVKYFLMSGGRATRNHDGRLQSGGMWKEAETWPPDGFREQKFYLHGDGNTPKSYLRVNSPPAAFNMIPGSLCRRWAGILTRGST